MKFDLNLLVHDALVSYENKVAKYCFNNHWMADVRVVGNEYFLHLFAGNINYDRVLQWMNEYPEVFPDILKQTRATDPAMVALWLTEVEQLRPIGDIHNEMTTIRIRRHNEHLYDLFKQNGVLGHPAAQKAYDMAYALYHTDGVKAIEEFFAELCDLITTEGLAWGE